VPAPDDVLADLRLLVANARIPVPGLVIPRDCSPTIGYWYWLRPLLNVPLTVTMTAPAQVQRGQTFTYEVSVLNTYESPFRLTSCPVYYQKLRERVTWYRLNCAGLSGFPPHRPVVFQMRMDVPVTAPTGSTPLSWLAVFGDGRVAIANMDTGGVSVEVTD
jgi:hypothetical protein